VKATFDGGAHGITTHRLLAALEQLGYVNKHPGDGKFSLGLKLFEFESRAVATIAGPAVRLSRKRIPALAGS
jgi:DNA-binding IclR family transcriptional regulator